MGEVGVGVCLVSGGGPMRSKLQGLVTAEVLSGLVRKDSFLLYGRGPFGPSLSALVLCMAKALSGLVC